MGHLANSPDVRSRILESAWSLIADRHDAAVPLVEIARQAGVSRQTLYVHFRSRVGLLEAMVAHRNATSPELAVLIESRLGMPTENALEAAVRGWFSYVPVIFTVARALSASATADVDAHQAWEGRMQLLRSGLLELMGRLDSEGRLAAGWTPVTASDWCFHLIHIDTWQHLVVERRWRAEAVIDVTVSTLMSVLLRPPR